MKKTILMVSLKIDDIEPKLDELYHEFEKRKKFCNNKYPFTVNNRGYTLYYKNKENSQYTQIYRFLLFATRLNMRDYKVQNGYDGTLLFEELAEYISRNYLGEKANSFLMGTSNNSSNFEEKINKLTLLMGEGAEFKRKDFTNPSVHKDDKLDIAVWKSFADKHPGKLICFGQCKTGTNWKQDLCQLRPDAFCKLWFSSAPAVDPIRMFFITEGIARDRWLEYAVNGGILFDRFRIMDYLPEIDKDLYERITAWVECVLKAELL